MKQEDAIIEDLKRTNPELRTLLQRRKRRNIFGVLWRVGQEWVRGVIGRWGRMEVPLGTRGEAYAAKYLKKCGYTLIVRNRREKKGEIDLIVMDKEFLVFVEVRTRSSEDFMTPEASIRAEKRRTVRRTVRRLIRKHKTAGLRPRIDVVGIIWPAGAKEPREVRHHKGVIAVGDF